MGLVTDNIQDFVAQIKRPEPTPEKPTPSLKGVDFFKDTHAKGFVIGKNPTDTDFILDGFPRLKDVDFFQNSQTFLIVGVMFLYHLMKIIQFKLL